MEDEDIPQEAIYKSKAESDRNHTTLYGNWVKVRQAKRAQKEYMANR